MPLAELDPSLCVALLCQSLEAFDGLCDAFARLATKCLPPFSLNDFPPRIPRELDERLSRGNGDGDEDDLCVL